MIETAEKTKPAIPFTEVSIESILLDADLFIKYRSPEKAFTLLRESMERSPRSISLRNQNALNLHFTKKFNRSRRPMSGVG